jgi:soluble lytic murein transglycosylase-like protein
LNDLTRTILADVKTVQRRMARFAEAAPSMEAGAASFRALIARSAAREGVDPALLEAVIAKESAFDAHAKSAAGAMGLMQLMPQTAAALGVTDPYDPAQNVQGGARYLRRLLDRFGDVRLALAAYNAGPGAIERYAGIPPYEETRAYVGQVLATYHALARRPGASR